MRLKVQNNKGFSVVEVLIVIIIVGLLGVSGWLVHKRSSKQKVVNTANSIISEKPPITITNKTYNDGGANASFMYPSNWIITPITGAGCDEPDGCQPQRDKITPATITSPDKKLVLTWTAVGGVGGACIGDTIAEATNCADVTVFNSTALQGSKDLYVVEGVVQYGKDSGEDSSGYIPFMAIQNKADVDAYQNHQPILFYQLFKNTTDGDNYTFSMDQNYPMAANASIPTPRALFQSPDAAKSFFNTANVKDAEKILLSLKFQ